MTEQTTAFGSTAVAEPPAPLVPTSFDDAADDNSKRKLAVVGAAAAVVVVLIAAFFLMRGGSSDSTAGFPPPHQATTPAAPTTDTAKKPVKLPSTFSGKIGRDPFKALYHPAAVPAAGAGGVSAPTTTTPGVPVVGGTGTTTTGTTTPPTTTTGGTGTTTQTDSTAPLWVELDSLAKNGEPTFRIMYADQVAIVYRHVGLPRNGSQTIFGQLFALLGVHNGVATVKYGDGTPFSVKPGYDSRHFLG